MIGDCDEHRKRCDDCRNFVIRYEIWEGINAHSKEAAIAIFKQQFPNVQILDVRG
jgi:hypothetical protein